MKSRRLQIMGSSFWLLFVSYAAFDLWQEMIGQLSVTGMPLPPEILAVILTVALWVVNHSILFSLVALRQNKQRSLPRRLTISLVTTMASVGLGFMALKLPFLKPVFQELIVTSTAFTFIGGWIVWYSNRQPKEDFYRSTDHL